MNKTFKKMTIILIVVCVIAGYAVYWVFFDIQRIKGQEQIAESTSPNGTYTVYAYLNNGGATTSYAVLGSVKNNKTNRQKNIYWQYRWETAVIEWLDDVTVRINGKTLDVRKNTYDYRHD
ncbi:DUF5412 domain-containing protein [Lacrimispora sp.]|uniref:DUF5412 domain-containing protein n=1 Tax=Lacrimispora sp. TaxID=2719234 RepID=UPI002FD9D4C9